ncbi:hypothetical protein B0T10DRAFT_568776 [Thelonectria olida]|uniref:Uncharacterized protein n=1 Tax=Thelonectria olida TaxID=1576542 RepID=A0A9P8VS86_9HYPO|nr:hypothetical protein B0T10DRAFT_568776 [Thelonectria olida]
MASLQQSILLWKSNQFLSDAISVPKGSNAREKLFRELVEDENIVRDTKNGIELLNQACLAIAATQAFRKQPDQYNPNILTTYDFMLLARILRLFFPCDMMEGHRNLTTVTKGLSSFNFDVPSFKQGFGVKRPRGDETEMEGSNKKLKGLSFDPNITAKRPRGDETETEGSNKKLKGLSFDPNITAKRLRGDETEMEGSNKKLKGLYFDPNITAKRPRGDETETEGSNKKLKGLSFDPNITAKRPRGDETEMEGSNKKPKGLSFDPNIKAKRPRGDETEMEGSNKKPKGLSFDPNISAKRPRGDETEPEGSNKKQKSISPHQKTATLFTFDGIKLKQEPEN